MHHKSTPPGPRNHAKNARVFFVGPILALILHYGGAHPSLPRVVIVHDCSAVPPGLLVPVMAL
jgi:hypothetical protein